MTRWHVAVQVSTILRHTVDLTVEAENKTMAEAVASAEVRQGAGLEAAEPAHPLRAIRWQVDKAHATEIGQ